MFWRCGVIQKKCNHAPNCFIALKPAEKRIPGHGWGEYVFTIKQCNRIHRRCRPTYISRRIDVKGIFGFSSAPKVSCLGKRLLGKNALLVKKNQRRDSVGAMVEGIHVSCIDRAICQSYDSPDIVNVYNCDPVDSISVLAAENQIQSTLF